METVVSPYGNKVSPVGNRRFTLWKQKFLRQGIGKEQIVLTK